MWFSWKKDHFVELNQFKYSRNDKVFISLGVTLKIMKHMFEETYTTNSICTTVPRLEQRNYYWRYEAIPYEPTSAKLIYIFISFFERWKLWLMIVSWKNGRRIRLILKWTLFRNCFFCFQFSSTWENKSPLVNCVRWSRNNFLIKIKNFFFLANELLWWIFLLLLEQWVQRRDKMEFRKQNII